MSKRTPANKQQKRQKKCSKNISHFQFEPQGPPKKANTLISAKSGVSVDSRERAKKRAKPHSLRISSQISELLRGRQGGEGGGRKTSRRTGPSQNVFFGPLLQVLPPTSGVIALSKNFGTFSSPIRFSPPPPKYHCATHTHDPKGFENGLVRFAVPCEQFPLADVAAAPEWRYAKLQ